MTKDTEFYDSVSDRYSADRYPVVARSYTQFFFKKRLAAVIDLIGRSTKKTDTDLSVLEIGCADGIVLREVYETFRERFSHCIGIDASPKMIESASRKNQGTKNIVFRTRDAYDAAAKHDVVIEVGVINYISSAENEMMYVHKALADGGRYICSLAGSGSAWDRVKPGDKGFSNFLSYEEYERLLRKLFVVEKEIPVGFFVPLLWRIPALARVVQPVVENILGPFVSGLFHEKVYLLRKR